MNRSFIRTRAAKIRHFPELTIWLIFALRTSKCYFLRSFKKRMCCCNGENLSFLFSSSSLCLLLLLTFDYLGFFSATHLLIIAFFRFSISCFNVFSAAFSLLQVHKTRQETLPSSTSKLLLQYFVTIWLSPMGNEQMRKLKNIFSGRIGRSSFIRLHQSYDPTKKSKISLGLLHLVL